MANVKSFDGNPIVLGASGIEDGAVTLDKLGGGANLGIKNLTDYAGLIQNTRINYVNGNRNNLTNAASSGYINVSGYSYLILTMRFVRSSGASGLAFYSSTSEDTFISGVRDPYDSSLESDTYTVVRVKIPTGAVYVRTTWWGSSTSQYGEVTFGCFAEKSPWYLDEYSLTKKSRYYDKMLVTMLGIDITSLFNSWASGKRINGNTGARQSSSVCKASDFVDVSGYESVILTSCFFTSGSANGLAFYDSNEDYVSGKTPPYDSTLAADTYRFIRVEVPSSAKYVRVSWWDDSTPQSTETPFFCVGEERKWRTVDVGEFRDEIARLEGEIGQSSTNTLPDYYFDGGYIDNRVSAVNAAIKAMSSKESQDRVIADELHGGDQFFWFTDLHSFKWSSGVYNGLNAHKLIEYIQSRTGIRKVFCGGDLVGGLGMTAATCRSNLLKVKDNLSDIWDDLYMLIGNHEWNNPSNDPDAISNMLTASELHTLLVKDKERDFGGVDSMGDYWLDNKAQKIRYICLGCNYKATFENEQIAWLGGTLGEVPDGYTVVVLSHIGLGHTGYVSTVPYVTDMLDAANAQSSYTYGGVTYDFTDFGGEVACMVCGHNHRDLSLQTTGGLWVISTVCDQGPEAGDSEAYVEARAYGTVNEQAIDVYLIDTTAKTIKTFRIGGSWDGTGALANPDRSFSYA